MAQRRIIKWSKQLLLALLALGAIATIFLWIQGRQTPTGRPEYVALGSSFAAGAGLGRMQEGSPLLCARSVGGYPRQLARLVHMSIIDMSCSGAVTRHLLNGGQYFQGPQIRTITDQTRLVTITVGGNDIDYIGDLSMLAARNGGSLSGWLARHFWNGPQTPAKRDYGKLRKELLATLHAVHEQSPDAMVVLATYPTVLPATGSCTRIGLTIAEADLMRQVGDQLAEVSRSAAVEGSAILVDMHVLGAGHNACSASPWVNGWQDSGLAPFHPNKEGAAATAEAIASKLNEMRLGKIEAR